MPPSTLQKHFGWCLAAFSLVVLIFGKAWHDASPPLDGILFGRLAILGFAAASFLLLFTLLQFHFAWHALRRMLRFLALLPMQSAFERLCERVVSTFGNYLFSLRPRHSHLAVSVHQYRGLGRLFPAFRKELKRAVQWKWWVGPLDPAILGEAWIEVQKVFPTPSRDMASDFEAELDATHEEDLEPPQKFLGDPPPQWPEWGGTAGKDSRELATALLRVVQYFWPAHTMDEAFGKKPLVEPLAGADGKAALLPSGREANPIRAWAIAAEDFVATEILCYLSQFIIQLRNLLASLTIMSLLLVLAVSTYPFFPQYELLLFLTLLGGGTAAFIVIFLVQLNRDEFISRVVRGTPNRFTPDLAFVQGATAYVLPIVAALMTLFPFFTSILRSLFDPLFHIIR